MTAKVQVRDKTTIITVEELKLFIGQSVNDAVRNHACRIRASDEVVNEIPDVMNAVKHIGGGDTAKGVVEIQDNHRFLSQLRKKRDRISTGISNSIIVAMTMGIAWCVWQGLKHYLNVK
jgi:hypothetical protein